MKNNVSYHAAVAKPVAVSLVAHGLNLKPEAMLPLIHWLGSQDSAVYLVQLSGHYEKGVAINKVTPAIWQHEMMEGYNIASKAARHHSVPLFFVGYSLGALLGQTMISLPLGHAAFDKQVFIAPAFCMRKRSYLLKGFFFLGKQFKLPSFTPKAFRAHKLLPMNIYEVLFAEERKLLRQQNKKGDTPTLILIDPKDELISCHRLKSYIQEARLRHYKLVLLNGSMKNRSGKYHHLVIDKETMGEENWAICTCEIKQFLF